MALAPKKQSKTNSRNVPCDLSKRRLSDLILPVLPHLVTHLYLNDNNLTTLPKDFFQQFKHMEWLDLRNNYLIDLPKIGYKEPSSSKVMIRLDSSNEEPKEEESKEETIKPPVALHTVLLQNNLLTQIPEALQQIPTLRVVQMHGNPCFKTPAVENFIKSLESEEEVQGKSSTESDKNSPTTPPRKNRISYECYEPSSHHFYGPSLEKVRELTMKRNLDRQRQLEQIQVDRQLQNLKDLRARERFRNSFHALKYKKNIPINFEAPPIGTDRDQRTLNKYQIVFDAQPQSDEGEALDQLEAEIDRVLKRRTCFQSGIDSSDNTHLMSPDELRQSNLEVNRVLGLINKSKFKPKHRVVENKP